ncbi:MAG: flagellar biosynthesis protein FliQ [Gammaproteobacteria bacterium]|nr:flagellar biosynthesis protein FliQ [Gammaproteobacteria bacterium]NVK87901.1 flagellar biosynthesis protein FliQ [Gammaproteobacteria bacterium]
MTPEIVVDVFSQAFGLVILLAGFILLPGLVIGLIIAIFQAATSINEQTLTFLPRLLVTLLTLSFLGHWMVGNLVDFATTLYTSIPELIG